jgi:hypothetical protein
MRLDTVEKALRSLSDLPCEATKNEDVYVLCGKPATHVFEFEDEEGRKHLFLCNDHAGQVDKRTILDGWSDVRVTPL